MRREEKKQGRVKWKNPNLPLIVSLVQSLYGVRRYGMCREAKQPTEPDWVVYGDLHAYKVF